MSSGPLETSSLHQIGEVAEATGLSIRTIRHYDEMGIVPPSGHTSGGFRLYTDSDIERLEFVKQMKPLNFTLDEMGELLHALERARDSHQIGRDDRLIEQLLAYAEDAEGRCAALARQLRNGEALAKELRERANAIVQREH